MTVADLLRFRRFSRDDLASYAAWFENPETSERMPFADTDWFDYVTHPDGGSVAEVVTIGASAEPAAVLQYDIDNDDGISLLLAVRPELRTRGLGTRVMEGFLSRVMDRFNHIDAWVGRDNAAAAALLYKLSFRPRVAANEDGFTRFRRRLRD